jgi:hypothetical protein
MPFPFSLLYELLNRLDQNRTKLLRTAMIAGLDIETVVA